jgi:hypothetical protein
MLDGTTKVVPFPFIFLLFVFIFDLFVLFLFRCPFSFSPHPFATSCFLHGDDFLQRFQQAVYFFHCVVVDQADAKEATGFFYVEMFGEIEGVVVAVPTRRSRAHLVCWRVPAGYDLQFLLPAWGIARQIWQDR